MLSYLYNEYTFYLVKISEITGFLLTISATIPNSSRSSLFIPWLIVSPNFKLPPGNDHNPT